MVAHVEVTSSQLQSLATSAKEIVAAPGTNKVIDVLSLSVYGQKGTTAYNFGNALEFDCNSTVFATLPAVTANTNADYAVKLMVGGGASNPLSLSANQPLQLTTSANPTQGDGKVFVNVYYRILTLGTLF